MRTQVAQAFTPGRIQEILLANHSLIFFSLPCREKQGKPPKKARLFSLLRTPKGLRSQGKREKCSKKQGNFLQWQKQGNPKKQGKEDQGLCMVSRQGAFILQKATNITCSSARKLCGSCGHVVSVTPDSITKILKWAMQVGKSIFSPFACLPKLHLSELIRRKFTDTDSNL